MRTRETASWLFIPAPIGKRAGKTSKARQALPDFALQQQGQEKELFT